MSNYIAYPIVLSETEKAYIAGMVDGEGSITILAHKRQRHEIRNWSIEFYLKLIVHNTNREVIEYIYSKVGGHIATIKPSIDKRNPDVKRRMIYRWVVSGPKALRIIDMIYPYLIVKRKHAEIARHFQITKKFNGKKLPQDIKDLRIELAYQMKDINLGKGRPWKCLPPLVTQ